MRQLLPEIRDLYRISPEETDRPTNSIRKEEMQGEKKKTQSANKN